MQTLIQKVLLSVMMNLKVKNLMKSKLSKNQKESTLKDSHTKSKVQDTLNPKFKSTHSIYITKMEAQEISMMTRKRTLIWKWSSKVQINRKKQKIYKKKRMAINKSNKKKMSKIKAVEKRIREALLA